jgi:hypothetical protein
VTAGVLLPHLGPQSVLSERVKFPQIQKKKEVIEVNYIYLLKASESHDIFFIFFSFFIFIFEIYINLF